MHYFLCNFKKNQYFQKASPENTLPSMQGR